MAMFGKHLKWICHYSGHWKKEIMEACQKTSSVAHLTERIGPVAALETLNVMEKLNPGLLYPKQDYMLRKMEKLSKNTVYQLKYKELMFCQILFFLSNNHNLFKTYLTQEMLKKNILATNAIYISTSHTKKVLDKYFVVLEDIFNILSKHLQ